MSRLNIVSFASGRFGANGEFLGSGNAPEFGPAYGRRGGAGMRVNVSALTEYVRIGGVNSEGEAAQFSATDLHVRWYMKVVALPPAEELVFFPAASPYGAWLTILPSGLLKLWGIGTPVGTSTTSVGDGRWHMVEVRVTAGAAGSQTAELRIDGAVEVTTSTATTSTTPFLEVYLGMGLAWSSTGYDIYFSDVAIDDSEYPGQGQVKRVYASGPGLYDDWDGDWRSVDEWPATAYLDLQAAGNFNQSVTFPAARQAIANAIKSMKCVFDAAYYNTSPAPTNVLQLVVYTGTSSVGTGPTWDPASAALDYKHGFLMLQLHPTTGLPWTSEQVARGLDFQVRSYTSGAAYLRCQLMALDVEYDPEPESCGHYFVDPRRLCTRVVVDWHSDENGDMVVENVPARGVLDRVVTAPSRAAPPDANYDVELVRAGFDEDVFQGLLADRSSADVEVVYPYHTVSLKRYRVSLDGKYDLRVSSAGARKAGTVVLYVLNEKTGPASGPKL